MTDENQDTSAAGLEQRARDIVYGGLFVALGVVVPVLFHALGLGAAFLPMHLPVLTAGLLLTPGAAAAVGLLTPWVSMLATHMPPPHYAVLMSLELPLLGYTAALLVRLRAPLVAAAAAAVAVRCIATLGLTSLLSRYLGFQFNVGWAALAVGLPGTLLQIILAPSAAAMVRSRRGLPRGANDAAS